MKVVLGADHGGFEMKNQIKQFLKDKGFDVDDKGALSLDPEDDYVDFAKAVAQEVAGNQDDRGILFCRSAAGMVIAANKINNVRAATAFDVKSAVHSREHNDTNVIALSGDWLDVQKAKEIISAWIDTAFSPEERHHRRVHKIAELEHA